MEGSKRVKGSKRVLLLLTNNLHESSLFLHILTLQEKRKEQSNRPGKPIIHKYVHKEALTIQLDINLIIYCYSSSLGRPQ